MDGETESEFLYATLEMSAILAWLVQQESKRHHELGQRPKGLVDVEERVRAMNDSVRRIRRLNHMGGDDRPRKEQQTA
jgi:hypothetical protein